MDRNSWSGIVKRFNSCQQMVKDWDDGHYLVGTPAQHQLEIELTKIMARPTITTTRGMTAIMSVISTFTRGGSTIACSEDIYPGTRVYINELLNSGRLGNVIWFNPAKPGKSLDSRFISLVFTETFGNARQMRVADVSLLLKCRWNETCFLVVDTTFTPLFVPFADPQLILVCSMTKYHQSKDEQMGGFIAGDQNIISTIRDSRIYQNLAMPPAVAKFYLRSGILNRVEQRYSQYCINAVNLAKICAEHQAVEKVWYPGLPTHPQNELVLRNYQDLGGGVFYLQLKGGEKAAIQLADQLAEGIWKIAVSFGSSSWRIFPFVGESLRRHVDCEGLVRISSGLSNPLANTKAFRQALSSLVS